MRFILYRSDTTQVGLTSSYTRGFGRKVTQARLTSALTWSLGLSRINPSFGNNKPGTAVSASMGFGYEDRLFVWEPLKGLSVGASLGAVAIAFDDGAARGHGTASAAVEYLLPVADGHGFGFAAAAATVIGRPQDLSFARQMVSPGAVGLRGYDVQWLLGNWYAWGRAEYRHIFVHDLDVNLLHSLYVRGIGGGLFAEAGVAAPCGSYALDKTSPVVDVGYSLRLFGDWFGVSQTTVNIDIAVPLIEPTRNCFGEISSPHNRVPLGFYFSFGPPW
jgi:hypothetical protein